MASSTPKTVGVVSTGVIGSSWIALFLAHGHEVIVCSPSGSEDTKEKLDAYLAKVWPSLETTAQQFGGSVENYKFVGKSLDGYYDQISFIQEVNITGYHDPLSPYSPLISGFFIIILAC
jgi:3-hydroxyacyl-CoA dehydrogenase